MDLKPAYEMDNNSISLKEARRNSLRTNVVDALQIKMQALKLRSENGDMLSGALLEALEEAERAAEYDLEISSYEYAASVFAVRDAYADEE